MKIRFRKNRETGHIERQVLVKFPEGKDPIYLTDIHDEYKWIEPSSEELDAIQHEPFLSSWVVGADDTRFSYLSVLQENGSIVLGQVSSLQ